MLKAFQYKKKDYDTIPLLLVLLGIEHHQEPVYRTHGVPMNQFLYCKKGQGKVIIDNQRYIVDEGQGFIILKDVPHEYHSNSDDWVLNIIGFNGNIVPLLLRTLKINKSSAYLLRGRETIEQHFDEIKILAEKNGTKKHHALSKELYSLLTDLSTSLTHITSESADYGNPIITKIIEHIESNYSDDISLDSLGELTSRTPEYLCSIFKEYTGLTIVKYLNNTRLLHASIMLVQEPTLPINEIARACGFRSPSYFGRQFQKHYNSTPNQYRMENIM